jgi:hypothetical protein
LLCRKLAENTSEFWSALPLVQALLPGQVSHNDHVYRNFLTCSCCFSIRVSILSRITSKIIIFCLDVFLFLYVLSFPWYYLVKL